MNQLGKLAVLSLVVGMGVLLYPIAIGPVFDGGNSVNAYKEERQRTGATGFAPKGTPADATRLPTWSYALREHKKNKKNQQEQEKD